MLLVLANQDTIRLTLNFIEISSSGAPFDDSQSSDLLPPAYDATKIETIVDEDVVQQSLSLSQRCSVDAISKVGYSFIFLMY